MWHQFADNCLGFKAPPHLIKRQTFLVPVALTCHTVRDFNFGKKQVHFSWTMFLVGLSRIRMIVLTDPDPGNLYVLAKYFLYMHKAWKIQKYSLVQVLIIK